MILGYLEFGNFGYKEFEMYFKSVVFCILIFLIIIFIFLDNILF